MVLSPDMNLNMSFMSMHEVTQNAGPSFWNDQKLSKSTSQNSKNQIWNFKSGTPRSHACSILFYYFGLPIFEFSNLKIVLRLSRIFSYFLGCSEYFLFESSSVLSVSHILFFYFFCFLIMGFHILRLCDTSTKKNFLSILGFSNFTSKIMRI